MAGSDVRTLLPAALVVLKGDKQRDAGASSSWKRPGMDSPQQPLDRAQSAHTLILAHFLLWIPRKIKTINLHLFKTLSL